MKQTMEMGEMDNRTNAALISREKRRRINRIKKIAKKQSKNIGFFEGIALKCVGCSDGKKGLPKMSQQDFWTSPYMDRKVNIYAVFADKIWAMLQNEHEEIYVQIEELLTSICQNRKCLEDSYMVLKQSEDGNPNACKKGEEKLSETIVKKRRAAERARNPRRGVIARLEQKILEDERKVIILLSYLDEDCNTVRMLCRTARDCMYQRLDVYWNAALKKHPEREHMPVVPQIQIKQEQEEHYMELHKQKTERVKGVMKHYTDDSNEEVA